MCTAEIVFFGAPLVLPGQILDAVVRSTAAALLLAAFVYVRKGGTVPPL